MNCGMFSAGAVSRHRACSGLPVLAAWRGFSQHSLAGNALFFFSSIASSFSGSPTTALPPCGLFGLFIFFYSAAEFEDSW